MRKRVVVLTMALALLALALAAPAAADHEAVLLDACDGVDHPPFTETYEGDGASYLLLAVRVDLPPGTGLTAAVFEADTAGTADPVSAVEGAVGDGGTAEFALPIYQFGTYDVFVGDADHDHPFLTARREVDASEAQCTAEDVAAAGESPTEGATPEATTPAATASAEATASPTGEPDETAQDAATEATEAVTEPVATAAEGSGDGFPWVAVLVIVLIAAAIGAWWLSQRRSRA